MLSLEILAAAIFVAAGTQAIVVAIDIGDDHRRVFDHPCLRIVGMDCHADLGGCLQHKQGDQ